VAALIKEKLNLEADLEPGGRGEFTVWAGGKKIAEKTRSGFPSESAIVEAVRTALE
jgi:hypothetical protein